MTYTFTYTYKYHEVQSYKGAEVVVMVVYDITAKRVNGSDTDTVTFENCQRYPLESYDKVIPRTYTKTTDEATGKVSDPVLNWSTRTDFTPLASLNIPVDTMAWVKSYHKDTSQNLNSLKELTDYYIG